MNFWDSSAVVPLLVAESSRDRLLALLQGDEQTLVWWGTPVECTSAISRREREGHLTTASASEAVHRLRAMLSAWNEVQPSSRVRDCAQRLLRVHPLRAADALQLAAAVVAADGDPASLGFVSLDERLRLAAQREGFPAVGG